MKIIISLFVLSFSLNLYAQSSTEERSSVIQKWEEVLPQKGYTLSEDLVKKNCAEIYNKQIRLFLNENPHVNDANLLRENELIWVQNCSKETPIRIFGTKKHKREKLLRKKDHREKLLREKDHFYAEVLLGASFLGEKNEDTAKNGLSLGVKFGYEWHFKNKHDVGTSIGYLFNNSKTSKSTDLGKYSVKTHLGTLDAYYAYGLSSKFRLGVIGTGVFSNDVSFKEENVNDSFGVYGGVLGIYKASRKIDLTFSAQQRIDESRTNVLTNFGLRFKFQ